MVAPEVTYAVVGILLFTLCVAHGLYCARCLKKRRKNKVEAEEEDFVIVSKRSLPQTLPSGGSNMQTPPPGGMIPRTPTPEYRGYQPRQPMYTGETPTGDPAKRGRPRRLNLTEE